MVSAISVLVNFTVLATASTNATIDWSNMVRPVRDGLCNAGPAQVLVEATEALHAIETQRPLELLSVQQLLDCGGGMQCGGGFIDFSYIAKKGICTETQYPRSGDLCSDGVTCESDTCHDSNCTHLKILKSATTLPEGNESALAQALTVAPVALAVDSDSTAFKSYAGGVFDESCGSQVNLPLLAVGFGFDPDSGKEYWKLKNYWGTAWGEHGLVRLVRGKNMCGVAQYAVQLIGGCLKERSTNCHLGASECCAGLTCKMSHGTYRQPQCLPP